MSYALPRNLPTIDEPNSAQSWGSPGRSRLQENGHASGGVADKIGGMFGDRKNSLPMYKDKPFKYPGSSRRVSWYMRKRSLILVLLSIVALLYWLTGFSAARTAGKSSRAGQGSGSWFTPSKEDKGNIVWEERREKVKDAFRLSWSSYETHAWGMDEYHPASKSSRQMVENGMGWIIVDALDTLMLMNLTDQLTHARQWISTTLSYDVNHEVNTFETTIRMLGGLLSAHYLSSTFPSMAPTKDSYSDDLYLEKASDLADRLLGAYNSKSGVPFASVNLQTTKGVTSRDDGGASSTAEATSLQLEMKYLAKLTGETHYWEKAEKVMQVVDDNGEVDGLLPIFIYADKGTFRGNNIRLGSRGDSYYEYLIKQYLQTSKQEPVYEEMWDQALAGVQKHLITYSAHSNLTILAERPSGLDKPISPKMDHLVCFMPGTIALGATGGKTLAVAKQSAGWTAKKDAEIELARQLTRTCWGMYKVTATGLAPEIAHFKLSDSSIKVDHEAEQSSHTLSDDPEAAWRHDYVIKANDVHNLQRPETVESLFYMWRITGDEMYRHWGWEMFEAFVSHTATSDGTGFSSIADVNKIPSPTRDNMESFWLAETLKYFYLLFGPDDILPLDEVVFNTEAHPFPHFELGKLFKTGWERKPRDKDGNVVRTPRTPDKPSEALKIQTIKVATKTADAEAVTQESKAVSAPAADVKDSV